VYFVYNRKLKAQKGKSSTTGITQWLRGLSTGAPQSGSLSSDQPHSAGQGTSVRTATEMEEQIATLLDDVYEEFLNEAKEMRKQFANDLEQVQTHMSNRLEHIERKLRELREEREERSMTALPGTDRDELSTETEADEITSHENFPTELSAKSNDEEDKSFLILEELYRGKTVAQVASSLEVGVQEVELVRQLLQSPPSK
jgi:hypothetical protein